jgi:hypothetical protein
VPSHRIALQSVRVIRYCRSAVSCLGVKIEDVSQMGKSTECYPSLKGGVACHGQLN